jgi:hypothetical protein
VGVHLVLIPDIESHTQARKTVSARAINSPYILCMHAGLSRQQNVHGAMRRFGRQIGSTHSAARIVATKSAKVTLSVGLDSTM